MYKKDRGHLAHQIGFVRVEKPTRVSLTTGGRQRIKNAKPLLPPASSSFSSLPLFSSFGRLLGKERVKRLNTQIRAPSPPLLLVVLYRWIVERERERNGQWSMTADRCAARRGLRCWRSPSSFGWFLPLSSKSLGSTAVSRWSESMPERTRLQVLPLSLALALSRLAPLLFDYVPLTLWPRFDRLDWKIFTLGMDRRWQSFWIRQKKTSNEFFIFEWTLWIAFLYVYDIEGRPCVVLVVVSVCARPSRAVFRWSLFFSFFLFGKFLLFCLAPRCWRAIDLQVVIKERTVVTIHNLHWHCFSTAYTDRSASDQWGPDCDLSTPSCRLVFQLFS